jgi:hypothetical protein
MIIKTWGTTQEAAEGYSKHRCVATSPTNHTCMCFCFCFHMQP